MAKYTPAPVFERDDPRTGDEFIREWAKHVGSVRAAERLAGMYPTHLHQWLKDPDRRLNPETTLKLSRAAGLPTEALEYRFRPIKDLDFWYWVDEVK